MGSYLLIPKDTPKALLKMWFEKYKPFYNDFGEEHEFEDIFGDTTKKHIRFKYGVQTEQGFKNFYSPEQLRDIETIKGVIQEK